MNDKDFDDYVRGQPGTLFGELALEQRRKIAESYSQHSGVVSAPGKRRDQWAEPVRDHSSRTSSAPPVIKTKSQREKEASQAWALIGFIAVTWWALTIPDATLGGAAFVGAIAAAFLYKFYKPVLVIGLIALAFQLFA